MHEQNDITHPPSYALQLDYTPWATASADLRNQIASIFEEAGVSIQKETSSRGTGEDGETQPDGYQWAPTHLNVCLVIDGCEESSFHTHHIRDIVVTMRSRLAVACSQVRATFPKLPLGIAIIITSSTTYDRSFTPCSWKGSKRFLYAFSRLDSSADIQDGMNALEIDIADWSHVYGWYSKDKCWKII